MSPRGSCQSVRPAAAGEGCEWPPAPAGVTTRPGLTWDVTEIVAVPGDSFSTRLWLSLGQAGVILSEELSSQFGSECTDMCMMMSACRVGDIDGVSCADEDGEINNVSGSCEDSKLALADAVGVIKSRFWLVGVAAVRLMAGGSAASSVADAAVKLLVSSSGLQVWLGVGSSGKPTGELSTARLGDHGDQAVITDMEGAHSVSTSRF